MFGFLAQIARAFKEALRENERTAAELMARYGDDRHTSLSDSGSKHSYPTSRTKGEES